MSKTRICKECKWEVYKLSDTPKDKWWCSECGDIPIKETIKISTTVYIGWGIKKLLDRGVGDYLYPSKDDLRRIYWNKGL